MTDLREKYLSLLMLKNQQFNLISRRATESDVNKHIDDSLRLNQYLNLGNLKVLDMGSGQGLPAIPLAIANHDARFVLVEADGKKAGFLEEIGRELGLENITVMQERIEILGRKVEHRAQYDVLTARGLAALSVLIEWGLPLLKKEGVLIAWKGPGLEAEIENSSYALKQLGGVIDRIEKYEIDDKQRYLMFIKKIGDTPDRYPRKVGIAQKRPLRKG
jgi:16S rRNA (guanine527-N7)-methyltransferase